MLGGTGGGKTSLRNYFLYSNHTVQYTPTTNSDFVSTYITLDNEEMVAVQIWDTSECKPDLPTTQSLAQDADGIMLVYDGSSKASLLALEKHLLTIAKVSQTRRSKLPVVLVQTKCDLEVDDEQRDECKRVKELCQSRLEIDDIQCIETSARTGLGVALAFQTIAELCHSQWRGAMTPDVSERPPKMRPSRHGDPIALREIIAVLTPYELAVARRELLLVNGQSAAFDILLCLPAEIVLNIYKSLSASDIRECSMVCKRWRAIATSANVASDHLQMAMIRTDIPLDAKNAPVVTLQWLAEREWRWGSARPAFSGAISVKSYISAIAVSNTWMVLSSERALKAWHMNGTMRQCMNVRGNMAHHISICPSEATMFVSTYLRQARVYSLVNFEVLFEVSSVAEPMSYVDMYHNYSVVLRGRNVVEVYKWQEQTLAARFVVLDSRVCGIKLCANNILVVATTVWNLFLYDIETAELLQQIDVREFIETRFMTEAGPPRLKALHGIPGVIRIAIYSAHGFCGFTVEPERQRSSSFDIRRYGGSRLLLDAHLAFRLAIESSPAAPAVKAIVSLADERSAKLTVPRAFSIADGRMPPMDQEPDVVAMTDNAVALGYNNVGVSVLRFSPARSISVDPAQ
ncbi:negative regulation of toll-like receptor 9 signaling pathway [Coemansia sp. S16]|nr:negative regulation of toll-like receptor 9 signaling pathway [Coemansia sp. S16]